MDVHPVAVAQYFSFLMNNLILSFNSHWKISVSRMRNALV